MPLTSSLRAYPDLVASGRRRAGPERRRRRRRQGESHALRMGHRVTPAAAAALRWVRSLSSRTRSANSRRPSRASRPASPAHPQLSSPRSMRSCSAAISDIPDYGATPARAGGGRHRLQAGVAHIAEIGRNIANAMAVLAGSYAALTAPAGSPLAGGYALVARASRSLISRSTASPTTAPRPVAKIATVLAKASSYMANAANFLYAPPALAAAPAHGVTAGAYPVLPHPLDRLHRCSFHRSLSEAAPGRALARHHDDTIHAARNSRRHQRPAAALILTHATTG